MKVIFRNSIPYPVSHDMLVMSDIHLKMQQSSSAKLMVYEEDSNSKKMIPILLARKKGVQADNRTKKLQSKHTFQMNHTPNRHKKAFQSPRHLHSRIHVFVSVLQIGLKMHESIVGCHARPTVLVFVSQHKLKYSLAPPQYRFRPAVGFSVTAIDGMRFVYITLR